MLTNQSLSETSTINLIALGNQSTKLISMDQKFWLAILIVMLLYLIAMTIIIWRSRRQKRLWNSMNEYRSKDKLSDRIYGRIYCFLKTIPITQNYINRLAYRFRLISPCDQRSIAKITVELCLMSLSISILSFLLVFLINPRLITLITAVFAIIIFNSEIAGRTAKNLEININIEIQQLIEQEIHNYYINYRVDDALYLSLELLSPNMRAAAEQIYQLLLSDDKETALKEYYENVPNKFLREFVSLCAGVMERGDQLIDGKYLFVKNLENLYEQLEIELDKLQRLRMEFVGVIMIVVLPIFGMDLVKWFCINMKSTMDAFYYGKEGFLFDIGLLSITAIIYVIMHKSAEYLSFHQTNYHWFYLLDRISLIKKAMDNYCDKNASGIERLKRRLKNSGYHIRPRHFILRSFIIAGISFMMSMAIACYLNFTGRERQLIVDSEYVQTLTSASEDDQYSDMKELIESYTRKYLQHNQMGRESEEGIDREALVKALEREGCFHNSMINEALAEEIIKRVITYRSLHFSFLDLAASILLGAISYFIPSILLKYTATVSKNAMEDEVNQFHALIGMLMYHKNMTVKQILTEFESYAVVFKHSIRACIDNYSAGDVKALEQLKEEEPYAPLHRLIDNLIRCDDMPIYEAFHEIDVEREGYLSKRRLANEKSIRKRVFRAYLLAAIPFILLLAYGIIPTLVSSMNEISRTLKLLDAGW